MCKFLFSPGPLLYGQDFLAISSSVLENWPNFTASETGHPPLDAPSHINKLYVHIQQRKGPVILEYRRARGEYNRGGDEMWGMQRMCPTPP